jgi:hypothetical protein
MHSIESIDPALSRYREGRPADSWMKAGIESGRGFM